ncbi:acyltransferase family protein [Streptomyces spongiae]|uniref:Acyltransferase n=1 Tax=Streptomyces spongiae TaxID=565072 RepID=A0A5N8XFF4_9ACTN|nr:acyltransferase [Streptomyces spongiae]MPY58192.1 acyltransferase [Streptomyces spongiae]
MNSPAKTAPPTTSSQETTPQGAARPGIRPGDPSRRAGPDAVVVPPRITRRAPAPRLRALDGLRLIAALMVAAYHYGGRDGEISEAWGTSSKQQFPTLHEWFAYGCLGVQIFFVISGFVICMSGWGRPLRSFFLSRASRLLPAYWAAVIMVTVVFALPAVTYEAVSPSDALVNLTMMQQPLGVDRVLGVCWTLWAEVRFYALFALCVVLPGATRSRVIMFCACWTLAAVIAQSANEPLLDVVLMPEYAPFFIGGIGLYLVHRDRYDTYAWGIVAVSWLIGQHQVVRAMWHAPNPDFFSFRSSYVIVLVVTLGFVAVAAIALGWLNRINWPWLTVAGALTYPFYLVHEHLGWVSVDVLHQGLGLSSGLTLGLTLAGMLILAWVLHRGVEARLGPVLRRSLNRSRL